MRPHGGSHRHEEGQQREAPFIMGFIEIAVHHKIGEIRQAAMPQVHQQECEVVEHVYGGDLVVELDAVEQARRAIEEADIAQVQIAMAAAQPALRTTPVEQRGVPRQRLAEGCVEGLRLPRRENMAGGKSGFVDVEDGRPCWRRPALPARLALRGGMPRSCGQPRSSALASARRAGPWRPEGRTGRSAPFRSVHRRVRPNRQRRSRHLAG